MTRRLAVIPARGGSKRLPNKNIREFCGRPMIAHILEAARGAGLFETVHVSTEDETIRETCAALGLPPDFPRAAHLADDTAAIMPVLRFVLETYESQDRTFDEVWLLMACAPLIEATDLIQASKMFDDHGGATPLLAVTRFPVPVEWAFDLDSSGRLTEVQPDMFAVRSQDLPVRHHDSGTFAVFPSDIVAGRSPMGSLTGFLGYDLPRYKAIDIDDAEDWDLAERIFRGSHRNRGDA